MRDHLEARSGPSSLPLARLTRQIELLASRLVDAEERHAAVHARLPAERRASARNLLHYVALRQHDISPLQEELTALGVSSLGWREAQVLDSVHAVLRLLRTLQSPAAPVRGLDCESPPPVDGRELLVGRTRTLLGDAPAGRRVRILVTMPSEAAENPRFVRDCLARGMDCMRINCAHDDESAWGRMIAHLRQAQRELGRDCRVLMDLAGPKLRTGTLPPQAAVVHWKPRRDELGRVREPARIWLTPAEAPEPSPHAAVTLPVPAAWLATLAPGDELEVETARGTRRQLRATSACGQSWWAEAKCSAYVLPRARLRRLRRAAEGGRTPRATRVGSLPQRPGFLLLHRGETLVLTRDTAAGAPAERDATGSAVRPASISCPLPEIFTAVRRGERLWFDDGKLGGVVRRVESGAVHVEITHAKPGGSKLHSDRGINLPDSDLQLPALTNKDLADLAFVATHADLVGLSFVQCPEDVHELRARLQALGAGQLGIVLKIETLRAFERLPQLLLAALQARAAGVMIARGDLAVECGWEHLAEIQEEILGLCEAAHLPVIWATQVLESLAKTGMPSRAEITDAAMSGCAEGVMLNKGPHVGEAIDVLAEILQRMAPHRSKRAARLPRSWAWGGAEPARLAPEFQWWGEVAGGDEPTVAGGPEAASGTNSIVAISS